MFGVCKVLKVFERSLTKAAFICSNIQWYYKIWRCSVLIYFEMSFLCQGKAVSSVSHDPSELNTICWFVVWLLLMLKTVLVNIKYE